MATVINNPNTQDVREDTHSGVGVVLGIIIVIAVLVPLFIYGLPALQNNGTGQEGTTVNISGQPDVNSNPGGSIPSE